MNACHPEEEQQGAGDGDQPGNDRDQRGAEAAEHQEERQQQEWDGDALTAGEVAGDGRHLVLFDSEVAAYLDRRAGHGIGHDAHGPRPADALLQPSRLPATSRSA